MLSALWRSMSAPYSPTQELATSAPSREPSPPGSDVSIHSSTVIRSRARPAAVWRSNVVG